MLTGVSGIWKPVKPDGTLFTGVVSANFGGPIDLSLVSSGAAFTAYGAYVGDANGLALYINIKDTNSATAITTDADFVAAEFAASPAVIDADLPKTAELLTVGVTTYGTYNGWPLYAYMPGGVAEAAGDAAAEGKDYTWYLLGADGNPILNTVVALTLDATAKISVATAKDNADVDFDYLTDENGNTLYVKTSDEFLLASADTATWVGLTQPSATTLPTADVGVTQALIWVAI